MAYSGRPGAGYAPNSYNSLSANEAMKSAESLLEQKTIAEIKEIEGKTRQDIEHKKKQLRALVGDSYRDLISGADTIVQMAEVCRQIVGNIADIQGSFAGLVSDISASKVNKAHKADSLRHEELYAVGSRVKYLVDTPEMIWGCLDSAAYLEASHRLLRAHEVHRLLTSGASKQVLHQFPLLRHQWPLVTKFRDQIAERCLVALRSDAQLASVVAADALAAVAFLNNSDAKQALDTYLDCRRSFIMMQLDAASADGTAPGADTVADLLCRVSGAVQDAVAQVGDLFLSPYMDTAPPMLAGKAAGDGVSASELLFGPMPSADGAAKQQESELDAWTACIGAIRARLQPLPPEAVATTVNEWLATIAAAHGPALQRLLAGCSSAGELVGVERAVRAALGGWSKRPACDAERKGSGRSSAGTLPAMLPTEGSAANSWLDVCDWVLGRRCMVWDEVMDAAFLSCVRSHIERWMLALADGLAGPLEACLQETAAGEAATIGAYRSATWPDAALPPLPWATASDAASFAVPQTGWRMRMEALRQEFDGQLARVLEGVVLLLEERPEEAGGSEDGGATAFEARAIASPRLGRRASAGLRRGSSARAMVLEPFVQDRCAQLVGLVADGLEARLQAAPPPAPGAAGAAHVEAALCVARLASRLVGHNAFVRVVLGSPQDWRANLQAGGGGGDALRPQMGSTGGLFKVRDQASALEALQSRLHAVAQSGYRCWAAWAAAGLAQALVEGLVRDDTLALNATLRSWEETVVSQEGDASLTQESAEMRFSLPSATSSPTAAFLLAAVSEAQRAGGHCLEAGVVGLLAWELSRAALGTLQGALAADAPLSKRLSEKGALQLLFDVRFMQDALAGARPAEADGLADGDVVLVAAKAASAWGALEAAIAERLDPIDWATYEPHLWANEARYYQRCSVLYGGFFQLHRLHAGVSMKVAANADTNIMTVAPPCARFSYLPISTPSLLAGAGGMGTSYGAPVAGHPADYSFANLGGERVGGIVSADVAASSSAFEALQKGFAGHKLGALGSLLGDKAAEVTAMAQQSLGEMSLPGSSSFAGTFAGSGTSFFSSLGKSFRTS